MTYSQFDQALLPIASHRRETAPAGVAPASVQEREALRRTTADMVRARVGLVMNWKILQLFLAHSQTEITWRASSASVGGATGARHSSGGCAPWNAAGSCARASRPVSRAPTG